MFEIVEKFLKLNFGATSRIFSTKTLGNKLNCESQEHLYLLHFVNRICIKLN